MKPEGEPTRIRPSLHMRLSGFIERVLAIWEVQNSDRPTMDAQLRAFGRQIGQRRPTTAEEARRFFDRDGK